MAFAAAVPWITSGLGFLGSLLGNRAKTNQQTSTSTTNSNNRVISQGGTSSVTNPTYSPEDLNFYGGIRDKYMGLMNQDPDLTGYRSNQVSQINHTSELEKQNLMESLASRGITGPAADAAIRSADARRFGNVTTLNNSIPLLSRQLKEDTLGKALTAFGAAPHGTASSSDYYGDTNSTGTSNTTGTGTATTPGNVAGGGLTDLASLLSFFYGQGAFGGGKNNNQNSSSPWGTS